MPVSIPTRRGAVPPHSSLQRKRCPKLVSEQETADGRSPSRARGGAAHRHQDTDARQVAVPWKGTARLDPRLADSRDVPPTRSRAVPCRAVGADAGAHPNAEASR